MRSSTPLVKCFLEAHALGLRSDGRAAVRSTYEEGYFTAFPDLVPEDVGQAFGEDVMVVWGTLDGTSRGEWMGVPPSGRSFSVSFANVTPFRDGLIEGETIYFDLATLCEQAALPLDEIRAAARKRRRPARKAAGKPETPPLSMQSGRFQYAGAFRRSNTRAVRTRQRARGQVRSRDR